MSALKKLFAGHAPKLGALEIFKYIGPGFIVTVGFIDPGNWASNIAAGASYGYSLLWMATLSTIMLIVLQHNAAHLGIVSGLCMSEAASVNFKRRYSVPFLLSSVAAAMATAAAELLGAAIGLNMLFGLPIPLGAALTAAAVSAFLFTKSYRKIEKYIIALVSLIGLAFLFELFLCDISWGAALKGAFVPSFPAGSMPIIMAVLGAVVMPHNLFLHSEIIQSRQWNLKGEEAINKQLKYEFYDTLAAMIVGWAINGSMIIVAAAVFFASGTEVTELSQAQASLKPLLGGAAAVVFAIALLLAGFSSSVTAGMSGASIFAGLYKEPMDLSDNHSRAGAIITYAGALAAIFVFSDPFKTLIYSQVALSIQLPFTVFGLIAMTSSAKIMGKYKNSPFDLALLIAIGAIVAALNVALLIDVLF